MSEEENVSFRELETAAAACAARKGGAFSAEEVFAELGRPVTPALKSKLERMLTGDERFFSDGNGGGISRAAFFRGFVFPVTPDAREIENGVLFPGHRFAPFVHADVFPSEVALRCAGGAAAAKKELTAPLSQIFPYHLLLGSEQVFDFFLADSAANAALTRSKQPSEPVTLQVFDLAEFYRRNRFSAGDALLCRVADWEHGRIEFEFLSADDRSDRAVKQSVAALEEALGKVIDRFENYLEIPEQLSWAFYLGGGSPENGGASLDEFIRRAERIRIDAEGDHTVLARTRGADDEYVPPPPEGLSLSRGETRELPALLKETGSPLTPVEIDSYILDAAYARELEFEDFFARAFGREKLKFADEGQQAVFLNYIEDRFEDLTGGYNRFDDEPKAPLRASILESVDERLEFFDYLASMEKPPEQLPQKPLRRLAEIALEFGEVLKRLNDPACTFTEEELDRLAESAELRFEEQQAVISELSDSFARSE